MGDAEISHGDGFPTGIRTNTNDDGDNTDFGPTLMETSADGGEANSDGDKRDVKQRW